VTSSAVVLACGRWLFKYRNRAFPVVLLALFAGFRPHLFGGSLASDLWLDAVGLGIALAGQWLRALVVGYAYIKRGGLNKTVYADQLVTNGMFAHSRNPLYVGNVMILAGLFVIYHHPLVYLLGGLFFGFTYHAIVTTEETFLADKFGDAYRRYCAAVPRWWAGVRETLAGMEFNWRRLLAKEFGSCLTWWLTALALLAYEAAASHEGLSRERSLSLLALAVVAVALFAAARLLKHRSPAAPGVP
jgi:protein-S-isoprenylcysteine O-methyltransferase Ste14